MTRGMLAGAVLVVTLVSGLPPLRALEQKPDIAYGPAPRQRLDLYLPHAAQRAEKKRPE